MLATLACSSYGSRHSERRQTFGRARYRRRCERVAIGFQTPHGRCKSSRPTARRGATRCTGRALQDRSSQNRGRCRSAEGIRPDDRCSQRDDRLSERHSGSGWRRATRTDRVQAASFDRLEARSTARLPAIGPRCALWPARRPYRHRWRGPGLGGCSFTALSRKAAADVVP
jgi:hypothetical protein